MSQRTNGADVTAVTKTVRAYYDGAVPRGVVDFERSVVILSDGVDGVGQDASRTVFARSTSLVD